MRIEIKVKPARSKL